MLLLLHYFENLLKHGPQLFDISSRGIVIETVIEASRADIDHGDHRGGSYIIIFLKILRVLIQQILPQIRILIANHLYEVVFKNLTDYHHKCFRILRMHILIPECIVSVPNRGAINLPASSQCVVIITFLNACLVIPILLNLEEAGALVIAQATIPLSGNS